MSQTTEELKFRLSEIARTVTAGAQNGQVAEVA
jgi:hypothetical protein